MQQRHQFAAQQRQQAQQQVEQVQQGNTSEVQSSKAIRKIRHCTSSNKFSIYNNSESSEETAEAAKPQQIKSKWSSGMKPELALSLPRRHLQESGIFVAYSHDASFRAGQRPDGTKVAHHSSCGTPRYRLDTVKDEYMRVSLTQTSCSASRNAWLAPTRAWADQTNYDTMPSALQLASFVERNWSRRSTLVDVETLDKLLSCGLESNPVPNQDFRSNCGSLLQARQSRYLPVPG
jgi:hypothetical protein